MIVVSVDLYSAVTGKKTNLGTAIIYNDGTGTNTRGNYEALTLRKGTKLKSWSKSTPVRRARVLNYARLKEPIWSLITEALCNMSYKLRR